ncbi:MAG: ATP-binding protein [Reyranella sp.]|nr:ATP-binding protein [Reyranella sp.]
MSIRSRLLLLVLVATLLPMLLVGSRFLFERAREVDVAIDNLSTTANDLAAQLNERIRGTVQLQYGLTRARELDTADRKTCSSFLSAVREEYPQYTGILTINPDGKLFCDSLGTGRELDLRDRKYFRQASASPSGVALEPVFGRLTGSAVLQIATPVNTPEGHLKFVLLASLNLEKFVQDRSSRGVEMLFVSFDGTVLVWSPENTRGYRKGSSIKNEALFTFAAEHIEGGAKVMTGVDGNLQVWAVAGSQAMRTAGIYVLVGQSRSTLVAEANRRFAQDMIVLGLVTIFLFFGVWLLAELGLRQQVARIGAMAKQLGSGDLQARIPLPHPRGELGGLMAVLNSTADSLERQRADIEDLSQKLLQSQKMDAIGQLTGGVAHDFNNILMVIMANVDALEEEETLEPRMLERLQEIGNATQRAADLTRQLLAFSRKQALQPKATNLNDLVADTGKLLRRALGEQIEIESVLADNLWTVNVDRAQLETTLVNLCLNARDAMPGGGKLQIETRNVTLNDDDASQAADVEAGDYAVLVVTDTGSGMPPETLAQVFDPFFTTKEVGKGTGLGLSMVYGFIKQSKGHITIHSEVGRGTTFRLYLPRSDSVQEGEAVEQPLPIPHGTERILVVEDEQQVRASVVAQLQSLGYTVTQASDGTAGLAAFAAAPQPYDLLLTDLVMPGTLNGRALADEVVRRWPRTKVVFVSGYAQAMLSGDHAPGPLLSKPFRKRDLALVVRQALDAAPGPDNVLPRAER